MCSFVYVPMCTHMHHPSQHGHRTAIKRNSRHRAECLSMSVNQFHAELWLVQASGLGGSGPARGRGGPALGDRAPGAGPRGPIITLLSQRNHWLRLTLRPGLGGPGLRRTSEAPTCTKVTLRPAFGDLGPGRPSGTGRRGPALGGPS